MTQEPQEAGNKTPAEMAREHEMETLVAMQNMDAFNRFREGTITNSITRSNMTLRIGTATNESIFKGME